VSSYGDISGTRRYVVTVTSMFFGYSSFAIDTGFPFILQGYMGYGISSMVAPLKCYNGYKNYQLGWYADKQSNVDPFSAPGTYTLSAFIHYDRATSSEPVILSIGDYYYIQLNQAELFNNETDVNRDQVTITANTVGFSTHVAGLAVNDQYVVDNYQGSGQKLVIKVCDRRDAVFPNVAAAMIMGIGMNSSYCVQDFPSSIHYPRPVSHTPTDAPTDAPTQAPTNAPGFVARYNSCKRGQQSCKLSKDCCGNLRCLKFFKAGPICGRCRKDKQRCLKSRDCCNGFHCNSTGVCAANIAVTAKAVDRSGTQQCLPLKSLCTGHSDCCVSSRCIKMKTYRCRPCRQQKMSCTDSFDCCKPFSCNNGYCARNAVHSSTTEKEKRHRPKGILLV
jgi:hypothetical protein